MTKDNFVTKIKDYINLIRIRQWYKNIVIFLSLFFVGELFSMDPIVKTLIGFASLCLISSANYILNDIIDRKKDLNHPEKKLRPIASGRISIMEAIIMFIILLSISLVSAYYLGWLFFGSILFILLFTLAYSLYLKNQVVADVISIAINFVVRCISGAFIIKVVVSPWIIVCPFFLALFLSLGKRDADLKFMKENAKNHKEVLEHYNEDFINTMMTVSTTCLIITYSLYSFSRNELFLTTLPFAIYVIFRYHLLVKQGSEIARHPEYFLKDPGLVAGIICWTLTTFLLIYLL